MSNGNEVMGQAYDAACRAVGLVGHEAAAQRYRNAVDAALEVLKPAIAAEALRMAAAVNVSRGEGRERVYDAAIIGYFAVRIHEIGRERRIKAAIDAAAPLIEAGALRAAAEAVEMPPGAAWPLKLRAEAIERGEVLDGR